RPWVGGWVERKLVLGGSAVCLSFNEDLDPAVGVTVSNHVAPIEGSVWIPGLKAPKAVDDARGNSARPTHEAERRGEAHAVSLFHVAQEVFGRVEIHIA